MVSLVPGNKQGVFSNRSMCHAGINDMKNEYLVRLQRHGDRK